MSGEKKPWRLTAPFRTFSRKQDLREKSKVGQSRGRVSSVYLSDSTSTSGFIVVPEFDDPVRIQTTHKESHHTTSHLPKPPAVTPSSPLSTNGISNYLYDLDSIGLHFGSYSVGGSYYPSVANTSRDDDLSQRLSFAYEHIRSMPFAVSPKVLLSSDPQILRKQLGVPRHSVLNHPINSSPDLPNPHAFLPEPTSPKVPPTAPPDVSHASPSKKLGLCITTAVYPISPPRDFPDSFETAQRTVSTSAESSPSQCHTLKAPWSAQITCTSNPRPSISRSWKLIKRRVQKPIITPSSLPSSRPQALRGVLRKQAVDTPRSANAHSCRISLPQIRSPSPFKVDIPLHHAWHDRRTNFNSFPLNHSKIIQFHDASSRRTSGSTEVLASLAWTGTRPISSSSYTTANRRRQPENPLFLPIAVEDDSISDNDLVDRLEKVRTIGRPSECFRDVSPLRSSDNAHSPGSPPTRDQLARSSDVLLPPPLIMEDANSDSEDAEVWQAARKALLCIREIVRTEKKYQDAIKMLLNAQTTTPPPPSMIPYISVLVQVSETLLKCYLEDPSAWGVSTALVASEDELETTMVSWCSVAGAFFMDGNDPQSNGLIGKWRLRKSGLTSSPPSSMTKQTSVTPSPRLPSVFPAISTVSKIKERMDEEHGARQQPQTEQEGQLTSVPLHKPGSTASQALADQPASRKLSVRDIAIQPIQRVMRYVLLYRDLLECTPPTSPSRLLVERALEAATRIANNCDKAQRNPAFIHAS